MWRRCGGDVAAMWWQCGPNAAAMRRPCDDHTTTPVWRLWRWRGNGMTTERTAGCMTTTLQQHGKQCGVIMKKNMFFCLCVGTILGLWWKVTRITFFGFCDMICMTGPGKDFKLKDMIGVIWSDRYGFQCSHWNGPWFVSRTKRAWPWEDTNRPCVCAQERKGEVTLNGCMFPVLAAFNLNCVRLMGLKQQQ